jgi:hypothetical protein
MKKIKDWLGCPEMDSHLKALMETATQRAELAGKPQITAMSMMIHLDGGHVAVVRSGCQCPDTLMAMLEALGKAFGAEVDLIERDQIPVAVH